MIHVLNYGCGVDSTAILLRWLQETESRPFDSLEDLLVLTAQTGNEFPSTKTLVEAHILPLLRYHSIRYVQVAKAGHSVRDGYTVVSDTRSPTTCYTEGDYSLGHAMAIAGTVPPRAGAHTCAMRWKGEVLDAWIKDNLSGQAIGPYLGYSAEEPNRAAKCMEYQCMGSEFLFPLIEWGWTRETSQAYLKENLGVDWLKSACSFCPFARPADVAERWQQEPDAGVYALLLETAAIALNPRMQLFGSTSGYELASADLLQRLAEALSGPKWAVYRVERVYRRSGRRTQCSRNVRAEIKGVTEEQAIATVRNIAGDRGLEIDWCDRFVRVYDVHRDSDAEMSAEGFWVAAPAFVRDKVASADRFQQLWAEATGQVQQLSIFQEVSTCR